MNTFKNACQSVRLLLSTGKPSNPYLLTKAFPCEDFYEDKAQELYNKLINQKTHMFVLSYEHEINQTKCSIEIIAVFLVVVDGEIDVETILPFVEREHPKEKKYIELAQQKRYNTSHLFAYEGSPIIFRPRK